MKESCHTHERGMSHTQAQSDFNCNTLYCNALQHTTHCNTLQHTALQQTATHSYKQQHSATCYTATHCNTLQQTALRQTETYCNSPSRLGLCTHRAVYTCGILRTGWLRLVGSLNLWVSFAKEPYKRDDILQKRLTILRSLLTVATPYLDNRMPKCKFMRVTRLIHTQT